MAEPCSVKRLHKAHEGCPGYKHPPKAPSSNYKPPKEILANEARRQIAEGGTPKYVPPVKQGFTKAEVALFQGKNPPPGTPKRLIIGPYEEQIWHEIDEETAKPTGHTEVRMRVIPRFPERRCHAFSRRGEWAGNRCCAYAIKGGVVCKTHGGSQPSVKRAAQARLTAAADPAAARLIHIALTKRGVEDRDRIKALLAILDRAGLAGAQTIELEIKPWERVLTRVAANMSGGTESDTLELVEGEDYDVEDQEIIDDND